MSTKAPASYFDYLDKFTRAKYTGDQYFRTRLLWNTTTLPAKAIAKLTNVPAQTIAAWKWRYGEVDNWKLRRKSRGPNNTSWQRSPEHQAQFEAVEKLAKTTALSVREIALKTGAKKGTVGRWIWQEGWRRKPTRPVDMPTRRPRQRQAD